MDVLCPRARHDDVLTTELGDELVVYDRRRDVGCSLNATAAAVWRLADGARSVAEIAAGLREQLGELADEDLVMVTLDRLEEQGLIESGYVRRDLEVTRLDRRRFIRGTGVVGAAALMLPVVQSVVAPAPAAAGSNACCGGELGSGPSPQKK
jgi:DNA-binding transcriptional ArsR family regulator